MAHWYDVLKKGIIVGWYLLLQLDNILLNMASLGQTFLRCCR